MAEMVDFFAGVLELCQGHPENSRRVRRLGPGIQLLDLLSGGNHAFLHGKDHWPLAKDRHTQRCRSLAGKGQKGSS